MQWFLRRESGALAIRRGDQAPAADQADDPAADVGAAGVAGFNGGPHLQKINPEQ